MSDSYHATRQPHDRRRQLLAWGLLLAWLTYSAGMLGWHLASDPLLSTYVCRTR